MPNSRNRKLSKLRKYRDQLLLKVAHLEAKVRDCEWTYGEITKATNKGDLLRVAALATDYLPHDETFLATNDAIEELTVIYRWLIVERTYTEQIDTALKNNDYLRARALCEQHLGEMGSHETLLAKWGKTHGIVHKLKQEMRDEDPC